MFLRIHLYALFWCISEKAFAGLLHIAPRALVVLPADAAGVEAQSVLLGLERLSKIIVVVLIWCLIFGFVVDRVIKREIKCLFLFTLLFAFSVILSVSSRIFHFWTWRPIYRIHFLIRAPPIFWDVEQAFLSMVLIQFHLALILPLLDHCLFQQDHTILLVMEHLQLLGQLVLRIVHKLFLIGHFGKIILIYGVQILEILP